MRWEVVRGGLLACVIAWQLVESLPAIPTISPEMLRRPEAQLELSRWQGAFGQLGIEVQRQELVSLARGFGDAMHRVHRVFDPLDPVAELLGVGQGWGLFAQADDVPGRLEIEVFAAGGASEVVYRRLDPDRTWRAERWAYRRMRAAYDQDVGRVASVFRRFTEVVAATRFAEDPDAVRVVVRIVPTRTQVPGHELPAEGRVVEIGKDRPTP